MAFRLVRTVTATSALAAGTWAFLVYRRISSVDRQRITFSDDVSQSFQESSTVKELVNPRGYAAVGDGYRVSLPLPAELRDVSDEVILARFIHSFYGGYTLAPERLLLQLFRPNFVKYSKLDTPDKKRIWSLADLPTHHLPPPHTILLGAFQVGSIHLADASPGQTSYIDFLFGKDHWQFAGAHRFSVSRRCSDESGVYLEMRLQSTSCNPLVDKAFGSSIMYAFHKLYAMTLFRESVAGMEMWLRG